MKEFIKKPAVSRLLFCLLSAAVLIAICSRSSPFYPFNNGADANCFFTVGKAMVRGVVPYRDIYEQKGPLLYFFYGLAYFVSKTTFFGVYLLETLAVAAFMYSVFRILGLYVEHAPLWAPAAVAAVLVASRSFALGGCSVEELSLPFLSWPLYYLLKMSRDREALRWPVVLLCGFFAGCVFWMKYTLTGFYLGWIFLLFIVYLRERGLVTALKAALIFMLGMLAASLPWMAYFGLHRSLGDLWQVYFYNNIFLYSAARASLAGTVWQGIRNFLSGMLDNLWYAVPAAAGLIWVLLAGGKRVAAREKACVLTVFGVMVFGIYIGGKAYAYYPLPVGVFAVFGLIPLVLQLNKLQKRLKAERIVPLCTAVLTLLCAVYAFLYSYNTYFFGAPRDVMVQYHFSDVMHRLEERPTLLNYGFMDSGFYTAADIVPNVKYFATLNIQHAVIKEAQDGYLLSGDVKFVITENAELDTKRFDNYKMVYTEEFHSKSYTSVYRLYQWHHPGLPEQIDA